jgi:extracellular elastinolytic metalloproteinase
VSPTRNKPLTLAAFGTTVLAVTLLGLPSQAATGGQHHLTSPTLQEGSFGGQRAPGFYDSRDLTGKALTQAQRKLVNHRSQAQTAYYHRLGTNADIQIDPLTGTPRQFGKRTGYLTGRSSQPARTVAWNYVTRNHAILGLKKADLSTFRFRQDYRDTLGIHHLSWSQQVRGATVFGNGLKVNVTKRGQVVSVQGSPVAGLARLAAKAPSTTTLSASGARSDAARDVHGTLDKGARVTLSRAGSSAQTVWSNHDYAKRVWFLTSSGLRSGWSTFVQTGKAGYQHVIDASSGRVLLRQSLTDDANGDAKVYDNFPGAARGGSPRVVNFFQRGWLKKSASFLNGDSVVAFTDINDDDVMQDSEKTKVPGTKTSAQFKLHHFGSSASAFCAEWVCTWNPNKVRSWKTNRQEATTNGFYFASNFHDYLAKKPIGFTPAAGNFEAVDGDPVMLNTLDGANTDSGMPDLNHIDNANMTTPPDGIPPKMQMYLFHAPGFNDNEDPLVPTTGSLDASVQYHEYTHGLSNRLVVDPDGVEALNTIQAGSMGEAWSDYYAMDYLVKKGFLKDTAKAGNLLEGDYVAAGQHIIRTMAIDCPVGATTSGCTSGFDGVTKGGYTYADFASVIDGPEVHASGEIWGQTLWQIRQTLGHDVADTLITRAMSLSPTEPTFLDMRNAILQVDQIAYHSSHTAALWKVFAQRGMGYFAGAVDGGDVAPAADFHRPPAPSTPRTSISGTVTDPTTGNGINGAVVRIAGLSDSFGMAVTRDGGRYTIQGIFPGVYPKVVASAPGYLGDESDVKEVDTSQPDPVDFTLTRDWAADNGGAEITDFNGPDFTPQCGPDSAIDTTQAKGWGSTTGDDIGTPTNVFVPKHITIDMHNVVDISEFLVDPTSTCGDPLSASTGEFSIETSPDGSTWTEAAHDTFAPGDGRFTLNEVAVNPGTGDGIRFVRFTILGNQVPDFATNCPDGPYAGCQFTDLTEFAVLGTPTP